jgi:hypothetical protein
MKDIIKYSRFDAELNTDPCDAYTNADLTLMLRLGFEQNNPPDGAATGTYHDYNRPDQPVHGIVRWDQVSWMKWKKDIVWIIEKSFNNRMWLLNQSAAFSYKGKKDTYWPNMNCKIKIIANEGTLPGNHHNIKVVQAAPGEYISSNEIYYSDVVKNWTDTVRISTGHMLRQIPIVHEVGHLLGFHHVDYGKPHCPIGSNWNAPACYGDFYDGSDLEPDFSKQSLMGLGMALRAENADPWRAAACDFKKKFYPTHLSKITEWPVYMHMQYPRTWNEVIKGILVTSRLKRDGE